MPVQSPQSTPEYLWSRRRTKAVGKPLSLVVSATMMYSLLLAMPSISRWEGYPRLDHIIIFIYRPLSARKEAWVEIGRDFCAFLSWREANSGEKKRDIVSSGA